MEAGDQLNCAEAKRVSNSSVTRVDVGRYAGIPTAVVTPVFKLALRLSSLEPTVDSIITQTNTQLDYAIVSALMDAALRLEPPDNTPQGIQARAEKNRRRADKAERAEQHFVAFFTRLGYRFLSEAQQKGFSNATPDILFAEPILICGCLCRWLEFKDFFGFRANPFIAASNKRQLQKYATQFGPGAVVYKLGFETDHLNIECVTAFREKEVLESLVMQDGGPIDDKNLVKKKAKTHKSTQATSQMKPDALSTNKSNRKSKVSKKYRKKDRRRRNDRLNLLLDSHVDKGASLGRA